MKDLLLIAVTILAVGCTKDDRPICPSCGERATMQMHPRMSGMGIKSYYKCDNGHNFTKGGVLVDVFGEPLKKESTKDKKLKLEGVKRDELEEREGIMYLKGSDTPYRGKSFTFYDNGQKEFEEDNWKDGKLDGLKVLWYSNGQRWSEINYKDGKREGLRVSWYKSGKKSREDNWKDGKLDGLYVEWHGNGQKASEVKYKDGKREGLRVSWYSNGQKWSEVNYKDGEEHGLDVWWHENGQKKSEINYKDGKLNGPWIDWYENGEKEREANYKDDEEHGLDVWWHKNGKKKLEVNYKDGKEVEGSAKYWNNKGEPVDTREESRK
tara:strand:- start:178 stop:1146 length:969 start_codon:yes stop_codon:yes gene_type:complete